jgi:hypothetical protein
MFSADQNPTFQCMFEWLIIHFLYFILLASLSLICVYSASIFINNFTHHKFQLHHLWFTSFHCLTFCYSLLSIFINHFKSISIHSDTKAVNVKCHVTHDCHTITNSLAEVSESIHRNARVTSVTSHEVRDSLKGVLSICRLIAACKDAKEMTWITHGTSFSHVTQQKQTTQSGVTAHWVTSCSVTESHPAQSQSHILLSHNHRHKHQITH